ncbi:MAG: hypothetical protein ACW99U_21155 [Candidatus Thorarchaeota archaeon]|jgi:hypothetical protein
MEKQELVRQTKKLIRRLRRRPQQQSELISALELLDKIEDIPVKDEIKTLSVLFDHEMLRD